MTLLFRLAFLNLHCQNNKKNSNYTVLDQFTGSPRLMWISENSRYILLISCLIYIIYSLLIIFSLSDFCVNSSTKNDCRTFQPKTFQPQCSTLDFLTPRFNTGLFNPKAIKNFSTPNLKPQTFQPQSHKELFNPKAIRNFSTPNLKPRIFRPQTFQSWTFQP